MSMFILLPYAGYIAMMAVIPEVGITSAHSW
jgi:hypothetical protein